jgi:hypothetical protein
MVNMRHVRDEKNDNELRRKRRVESSRSLGFAHDFVLLLSFYPFSFAQNFVGIFNFSLKVSLAKYTSSHGFR